jgi:hypothetical protein
VRIEMISEQKIQDIEEINERATPGPWTLEQVEIIRRGLNAKNDLELCIAARNIVVELISELRWLRNMNDIAQNTISVLKDENRILRLGLEIERPSPRLEIVGKVND